MPYIEPEHRRGFDAWVSSCPQPASIGELAYLITKILLARSPSSYPNFAILIGALETVKLELYRKMVAPYEDRKRMENGEVYPE